VYLREAFEPVDQLRVVALELVADRECLVGAGLGDEVRDAVGEHVDGILHEHRRRDLGLLGLCGEARGSDARSHRRAQRSGEHHLDRLVTAVGVAARPTRQLHEPRPELRPGLVGAVE